ncbi:unnamed protein product [Closterium sp. NIES-54]
MEKTVTPHTLPCEKTVTSHTLPCSNTTTNPHSCFPSTWRGGGGRAHLVVIEELMAPGGGVTEEVLHVVVHCLLRAHVHLQPLPSPRPSLKRPQRLHLVHRDWHGQGT